MQARIGVSWCEDNDVRETEEGGGNDLVMTPVLVCPNPKIDSPILSHTWRHDVGKRSKIPSCRSFEAEKSVLAMFVPPL